MTSYSFFFVSADKKDAAAKVFAGSPRLPAKIDLDPNSDWAAVRYNPDATPPSDDVLWGRASLTLEKSKDLGEIFFLFSDWRPDSLVYEHAKDGVMLRKLVWFQLFDNDEAGWLCADGSPEPWETGLFLPHKLERTIEDERERYSSNGEDERFPTREAEIRKVWETHEIVPKSRVPSCDGSVALLVEQHFRLNRP
jgi:hypothetical protein